MRTILSILIGLFIIGCGEEIIPKPPKKSYEIGDKDTKGNNIVTPLEGNYTLEEGVYLFSKNSNVREPITSSDLVIEKLDSDDYGYYFTVEVNKYSPIYFGIIHQQDNDFFKKIIYTKGMKDINISDVNLTEDEADQNLTTELKDKIKVSKNGDKLKIDMPLENNARAIITWRRVDKLDKTEKLKEAEHEYTKYYKERFNKYFKDD